MHSPGRPSEVRYRGENRPAYCTPDENVCFVFTLKRGNSISSFLCSFLLNDFQVVGSALQS